MLKYHVKPSVDGCRVQLDGELMDDSEAPLTRLLKVLVGPKVHFNCAGIARINSVGVVKWRHFIDEAQRQFTLEFEQVSVPFLGYVTMLPAFTGKGAILSIHLPFSCSSCKRSKDLLAQMADLKRTRKVPELVCDTCGSAMRPELDLEDLLQDLV